MKRKPVTLFKILIISVLIVLIFGYVSKQKDGANVIYVDSNDFVDPTGFDVQTHEGDEDSKTELKKIDWHDYKKIEEEKQRKGPGEQGQAVILNAEEEMMKKDLYKVNGFNGFVSDKISLHRSLNDIRHPDCKNKTYWNKLPSVSVIIPFREEHWTTLLRTVWSVLDRAPPGIIKEVFLVDDHSTMKEFLKKDLDEYVSKHFTNVKILRHNQREGLIRTRLTGARAATGDVLIFLDSHCEANVNWLPPLLSPIQENYKTVVCPFIDIIDYETFAYKPQDEGARGAFDWAFFYKRIPLTEDNLKHPTEPFESPVMAGGLFAISAKWFWELGGYDPGLDIWGGEQYELSFKIWQCGGRMIDAPCSRIGHVYTKFKPFSGSYVPNFLTRNYRRVAEVWMDEYAQYLYKRMPGILEIDPRDLTEQKELRQRLNCKPFKWFMTEVAFDLETFYPAVEPPMAAHGEVRNVAANMCIDTRFKGKMERFNVEKCLTDGGNGEQNMVFTWHKDIRPGRRSMCFDVSSYDINAVVLLFPCHNRFGNQQFMYHAENLQIYHVVSKLCIDCNPFTKEIFMNECASSKDSQKWKIENIDLDEMKRQGIAS